MADVMSDPQCVEASDAQVSTSNSPGLLGFWNLIVTQAEGAFNDNALKTLVTFFGLRLALSGRVHDSLFSLTAGLFSVPFLLFSMWGGFLADRFSKRTVTIGVK